MGYSVKYTVPVAVIEPPVLARSERPLLAVADETAGQTSSDPGAATQRYEARWLTPTYQTSVVAEMPPSAVELIEIQFSELPLSAGSLAKLDDRLEIPVVTAAGVVPTVARVTSYSQ